MSNFTWKSEEEWDDAIAVERKPRRKRPWRRFFAMGIIILTLISTLVGLSYWRIEAVDQQVSDEVISSYELIQEAVRLDDEELFISVLSGRSDEWVNTQTDLFTTVKLDNRTIFGFEIDSQPVDGTALAIELSPDLNSAIVQRQQAYIDRFGESVAMELTDVYRRGQTRWLLAPPEDEFWGDWVEFQEPTAIIDTKFPQRDAAVVWPVQQYLEEKVGELCSNIAYQCPPGFKVNIIFHPDPYTLVQWNDLEYSYTSEDQIVVPAPTLIGIPVDEAGEEALARAYASLVLPKVIVDLINYSCCVSEFPLIASFIERQLIYLDILPPVNQAELHQSFFLNPFIPSPIGFEDGFNINDDLLRKRGHIAAAYYEENTTVTTADLLSLTAAGDRNWMSELNRVIRDNRAIDFLPDHLLPRFVDEAFGGDNAPLPIAEKLIVICQDESRDRFVGEYDFQQNSWQTTPLDGRPQIGPIRQLDGQGLVWIDSSTRIMRYSNNRMDMVYKGDYPLNPLTIATSANTVAFYSFGRTSPTTVMGNVDDCTVDSCDFQVLENTVVLWAPDGDFGLWIENDDGGDEAIYLVDNQGQRQGQLEWQSRGGLWWISNDSFVKSEFQGEVGDFSISRVNIERLDQSTHLFYWSELNAALPDPESSSNVHMPQWFVAIPNNPDLIGAMVRTTLDASGTPFFAVYDYQNDEIVLLIDDFPRDFFSSSPVFDREGDFILFYRAILNRGRTNGRFVDLTNLTVVEETLPPILLPFTPEDLFDAGSRLVWSDDNKWLAQINGGFALVVNPRADTRRVITYPEGTQQCYGGGWLD